MSENAINDPIDMLFERDAFVTMPVLHTAKGKSFVTGSATCLWPGMFLTATHNVEEWGGVPGFRRIPGHKETPAEQYEVDLLHLTKQDPPLLWRVNRIKSVGKTDLTLLKSTQYSQKLGLELLKAQIKTALDFHLPKIGEVITTTGFLPQNEPANWTEGLELHRYTHLVEDVDFFAMPNIDGPAIQTPAAVIGGMSGGPVFNSKGRLIGICSTGIEPKDSEEGVDFYTSWISLITPILFEPIEVLLPSGMQRITIYELAKRGLLDAHGLNHIEPTKDGFNYHAVAPKCDECPDSIEELMKLGIKNFYSYSVKPEHH